MTAGRKHLKLIKRFYGIHVEDGAEPSAIMFHTPTSETEFTLERGRYVCFDKDNAYLINLDREDWELALELKGSGYINYRDKNMFMEGLIILNFAYTSVSYITKLNHIQRFDYFGLLRTRYMELEKKTVGLYLIKN